MLDIFLFCFKSGTKPLFLGLIIYVGWYCSCYLKFEIMNEFKIIKGKKGLVNIQNVQKFKNKHGWNLLQNKMEQHHLLLDKKNGTIEYERILNGKNTIQHFKIGDSVIYDQYNSYYRGEVISFTENNIIVNTGGCYKNTRIGWDVFCMYQSLSPEEVVENNTYWSYYI